MKLLRIGCILVLLLNIPLAFYIRGQFNNMDYDDLFAECSYDTYERHDDCYLEESDIHSLQDLIANSEYFLKVEILDETEYKCDTIMHQAEVLESYKGDLEEGKTITIYDNLNCFSGQYSEETDLSENTIYFQYMDDAIPIFVGQQYYVFLNKAEYSKNGYYTSSIQYGHISLDHEFKTTEDFEFDFDSNLYLSELEDVDCFEKYSKKYKSIRDELVEYIFTVDNKF